MTHYQQQLSMYGRPMASPRFTTSPIRWSRWSTARVVKVVAAALVELFVVVGLVAVSLGFGATGQGPTTSPMPAPAPVVGAPAAAPAPAPAPMPAPAPAPQP